MKLLNNVLIYIAPDSCVVCRKEPDSLCDDCRTTLSYPDRCYHCNKPSLASMVCGTCRRKTPLAALYVCTTYEGIGKELVWRMKYDSSRSATNVIGKILADVVPYFDENDTYVAHIPTTPGRIRERGFDQAASIAKRIAAEKHLTYLPALIRQTDFHQVGSTRKERHEHMEHAFIARNADLLRGKTIILVDDVLTTGATMESAARVLKHAGARRVVGAVFARAT